MKVPDEKIITELLSCSSNKKAATKCGISEKQLYNRMKDPTFKEKMTAARAQLMDGALAALQGRMSTAISVMFCIMANPDVSPQTRLNAATAFLQYSLRFSERNDLAERIAALEDAISGDML